MDFHKKSTIEDRLSQSRAFKQVSSAKVTTEEIAA